MKKLLKSALVGVVVLSSCMGFTACKDEPIEITMQEIYDANATATLLQTHEKLGSVKSYKDGAVEKTYLDGDVYYTSTTNADVTVSACYDKAGTVGYLFEGGEYFSLLTTPEQLKAQPTKAYENNVFADKQLALAEQVVSAVKKKDTVQVQTKYNETDSRTVALQDGVTYVAGGYVQTKYVLDADTYRVLSLERELVASGESVKYVTLEQKVDVKATEYSQDLAVILANVKALTSAELGGNTWMIHVEANSNTPNEEDWKAVALKEHSFKIALGERYPTLYRDESLKTKYVYTNADKDSGYIKLYAKRAYIPGEYGFTWADLVNANTTQSLANKNDSITVTTTYEGDEDSNVVYIDDNMVYTGYADTSRTYHIDGTLGYKKVGDEYFVIVDDENEMKAKVRMLYDNAVFQAERKLQERIDSVEKRGGKLYVTTIIDRETYDQFTGGESDFAYLQTEYVFDSATYALCQYEVYTVDENDVKTKDYTVTLTLNTETVPSDAEIMYEKCMATENVAYITVYVWNGTQVKKLWDGQRVKGDGLVIEYQNGAVELYTDEACTQVFTDENKQANTLTLYAVLSGMGQ